MRDFVQIAEGVQRLSLQGSDFVNVYLLGDVLVDAGGRMLAARLLRALDGHAVRAVAITHGHFDHQGGSHAVCSALAIPLWCGKGEREALETGRIDKLVQQRPAMVRLSRLLAGPAHPVARVLRQGDDVAAGFVTLETPGHTPGSLSFWREADRTLVVGDAAWARNPLTMRARLREPMEMFSTDPAENRASLRRLAALQPELVCFGHGPTAAGPLFREFVARLGARH